MTEKSAWERDREEFLADPENAQIYHQARARFQMTADFIATLDEVRSARGLSKAELARRVGVPAPSVRRFFTQQELNPSLALSLQLADALGVRFSVKRPASTQLQAAMRREPAARRVAAR